MIGVCIFILFAYRCHWIWTGFAFYEVSGSAATPQLSFKTLWDWLDLLIVPLVLGAGGLIFTWIQQQSEVAAAQQRETLERELAVDRARADTLRSYYDKMSDLLIDNGLRDSESDANVRSIARAWTLDALRGLDGERRGRVLQFLYETGLIGGQESDLDQIVKLDGAELSAALLAGADLTGACLSHVNLVGAKLDVAVLSYAALAWAKLIGASMRGTQFTETNLRGAELQHADLSLASLLHCKLVGADLTTAVLARADFDSADISDANLTGADLDGARHLSQMQLNSTRSYKGALNLPEHLRVDER